MIALDLFAGTGWGVACQRLGIDEFGVENMPEAIATREANGMETLFADVWDGLTGRHFTPDYDLLIASPPCQTFSMAGKGAGRAALDHVLEAIRTGAYHHPSELRAFGEKYDDKTALVLTPLAYIARDLPRLVVLEQVPTVLPVWEAYAEVMRSWGYSVKVAVLNAEQYGVPQTRKRAILVGRWDAEAVMPTPTHSRYYPTNPTKFDEGVKPWVSMAEALGWNQGVVTSAQSIAGDGRAEREVAKPGFTVTQTTSRVMRSNYGTGGDPEKRGERLAAQPAPTMTSKADRNKWVQERHRGAGMLERHGERKGRPVEEPALTITGNASGTTPGGFRVINLDPAKPATTVPGRGELGSREHHTHRANHNASNTRVTAEEAAALQSYPEGFTFSGAKGKQFLQIGNAVPPLLAEAILKVVLS